MGRRLLLVAVIALVVLGAWARGATDGYGRGKAHATATLAPVGSVVIGDGRCVFYPPKTVPELDPTRNYRAFFVTLLTPDDGR